MTGRPRSSLKDNLWSGVTCKVKSGAWVPGGKTLDIIQIPFQLLSFHSFQSHRSTRRRPARASLGGKRLISKSVLRLRIGKMSRSDCRFISSLRIQNDVDYRFISERRIQHAVIDCAIRPFDAEMLLNEISRVLCRPCPRDAERHPRSCLESRCFKKEPHTALNCQTADSRSRVTTLASRSRATVLASAFPYGAKKLAILS